MLKPATLAVVDALVDLENRTFDGERLSRRSFVHALTRGRAVTLVDTAGGLLRAYVMVFFHDRRSMGRIYSIAVDARWRGHGLGHRLLLAAEKLARGRGCGAMRAEVRADNKASRKLFERGGYAEIGRWVGYYEADGEDAVRYEKRL